MVLDEWSTTQCNIHKPVDKTALGGMEQALARLVGMASMIFVMDACLSGGDMDVLLHMIGGDMLVHWGAVALLNPRVRSKAIPFSSKSTCFEQ